MATPDIARIVSLIMENPKLIEEISSLARAEEATPESQEAEAVKAVPESAKENQKADDAPVFSTVEKTENGGDLKHRSRLLCALKPYVSRERAHAIDSMLSIVEILDLMKRR